MVKNSILDCAFDLINIWHDWYGSNIKSEWMENYALLITNALEKFSLFMNKKSLPFQSSRKELFSYVFRRPMEDFNLIKSCMRETSLRMCRCFRGFNVVKSINVMHKTFITGWKFFPISTLPTHTNEQNVVYDTFSALMFGPIKLLAFSSYSINKVFQRQCFLENNPIILT